MSPWLLSDKYTLSEIEMPLPQFNQEVKQKSKYTTLFTTMLFTLLSALKAEACIPFSSQVNSITSRDYISIPVDESDVISAPFGEIYLSSRLLFRYDKDHEEASNRTLEGKLTSSIIRGYRFHFSQCK